MAASEGPLVEAALLAIEDINRDGGLLGKKLRALIEDGGSAPETFFAEAAELGVWDYDPVHDVLTWSERMYRIFRVDPRTGEHTYALWTAQEHRPGGGSNF